MIDAYSPEVLWIIIISFITAFLLAFGVGANDVANSFGTSVGSKVLTLKQACIFATIFEMLGATLLSQDVSSTVRKEFFDLGLYKNEEKILLLGFLSALVGGAFWNILATYFRLPVSGTHSIVGATIGFHVVLKGFNGIRWIMIGKVVSSWFISPILSGAMSGAIYFGINETILKKEKPLEPGLIALPLFYGFTIFVNLLSIIIDGPEFLYLKNLPLWLSFSIAFVVGTSIAVFICIFVIPNQRKVILKKLEKASNEKVLQAEGKEEKIFEDITNEIVLKSVEINGDSKSLPIIENNFMKLDDRKPAKNSIVKDIEKIPAKVNTSGRHEEDDKLEVAHLFKYLQTLTACFNSFVHGGNDVSNAIGPLIAIVMIWMQGDVMQTGESPFYLPIFGGIGISLGLIIWGRRVIQTMGEDLTKINPSSGFTIEVGAASTVLFASKMGLPVSTTHCKVGSVVLVGRAKGSKESVDWKLFRNIAMAWVLTVPVSAACSAFTMYLLRFAA